MGTRLAEPPSANAAAGSPTAISSSSSTAVTSPRPAPPTASGKCATPSPISCAAPRSSSESPLFSVSRMRAARVFASFWLASIMSFWSSVGANEITGASNISDDDVLRAK
jgi:hypothetical protein